MGKLPTFTLLQASLEKRLVQCLVRTRLVLRGIYVIFFRRSRDTRKTLSTRRPPGVATPCRSGLLLYAQVRIVMFVASRLAWARRLLRYIFQVVRSRRNVAILES
jgi:hypothetical protein